LRVVGTRRFLWPAWGGQRALSDICMHGMCWYVMLMLYAEWHVHLYNSKRRG
jgi:hypothetical protein